MTVLIKVGRKVIIEQIGINSGQHMSFGGGSKCWIFNDDIEVNFWGIKRGILMMPNLFSVEKSF